MDAEAQVQLLKLQEFARCLTCVDAETWRSFCPSVQSCLLSIANNGMQQSCSAVEKILASITTDHELSVIVSPVILDNVFDQMSDELNVKTGMLCRFLDVESFDEFRGLKEDENEQKVLQAKLQQERERRDFLDSKLDTSIRQLLEFFTSIVNNLRSKDQIDVRKELLECMFTRFELQLKAAKMQIESKLQTDDILRKKLMKLQEAFESRVAEMNLLRSRRQMYENSWSNPRYRALIDEYNAAQKREMDLKDLLNN
eukprot:TRINITY_DN7994_c0_g1_i1.p1 TRINITY_DN7994_c0_g1~~TRINITY_DN7994_c0_g1_i1.p1  ORF type:complete len:274 (+),score=78.05 TRINITY_DN7994_c0_g1_i1:55-822(+)